MTPSRTFRAAVPLGAAALGAGTLLPGCQSQWFLTGDHADLVTTEVVVRTEPPGAMVFLNGRKMDTAPVRIPIEYDHVTQQWFRQSNYGASFLEGKDTLTTILTFPYWIPASLFHGREEMKRHTYGSNVHTVTAELEGHEDATAEITLEGEAEVEVRLVLPKR